MRSALVVALTLPPPIEQIRLRETAAARAGAPAHVTLVIPFVPPSALDDAVQRRVRSMIGTVPAFDLDLRLVRRWEPGGGAPEGVVWLEPEPAAPFVALIEALGDAFPDYPPYGGIHDTIIPHVTIASDDRRGLDAAEAGARLYLPIRQHVAAATLLSEGADGRWRTWRRFPLAGDAA